ncbi:MAG: SNF2-related protein [Opitutaceae bacterium]
MSYPITEYHAKFFAHELSKRFSSEDPEKLACALVDAPKVDLNPHQVLAALFAFRSPLSQGAILADEVGLGKTIEAGILLSQKWAERKRKILVIVPASLRMQWQRELKEKFLLPSVILEGKSFKRFLKSGCINPFDQERIVICSYHFGANKSEFMSLVPWDLVVIDEAHRLRNVYKNENKIARTLRDALDGTHKVLLTATPLQNSLLELYGLVTFIDPHTFGDLKSFRLRYGKISSENELFLELKERLRPICHRTLRGQVLEYVRYTNRVSIVQDFEPTSEEQALYELVSGYLRRGDLHALPSGMSTLMLLLFRKFLASSSFAIAGALDSLAQKLRGRLASDKSDQVLSVDLSGKKEELIAMHGEDDFLIGKRRLMQALENLTDESIKTEIAELESMRDFASSIQENAKGQALLKALDAGFSKVHALKAADKAIIFTESRQTQAYILRTLEKAKWSGKIVLFNGSNNDQRSRSIYESWKLRHQGSDTITGSRAVDVKTALVEYFRDEATIMIATEAAAEGVNLQFCSLVVNYDLPWNPQRIEQRIGRCHRYGQLHDVVVVNFLNRSNAADLRVYELLDQKCKLFDGVFGASDEVLGVLEEGMGLEARILNIYQTCRYSSQINAAFDALRQEFDVKINAEMQKTRQHLLENFDSEVHDKLRVNFQASNEYLDHYQNSLFKLSQFILRDHARFSEDEPMFELKRNPYPEQTIRLERYKIGEVRDDATVYRIGHPLAQSVIKQACDLELSRLHLLFDYSGSAQQVSILNDFVGKSGELRLTKLTIKSADVQDHLLWAARTDDGVVLDGEQCVRLFTVCRCLLRPVSEVLVDLSEITQHEIQKVLMRVAERNAHVFDEEMAKLEHWASDQQCGLEFEIKKLTAVIKKLKGESRVMVTVEDKFEIQRRVGGLEARLNNLRRDFFNAQDRIELRKDELLDSVQERLKHSATTEELFKVQFSIV